MSDLISRSAAILNMRINVAEAATLKATDPTYIAFLKAFERLFVSELDEAPSADVVPVVRCGECKNFKLYPDGEGTHYGQCLRWMVGGIDDDDYCSYGERKESEDA